MISRAEALKASAQERFDVVVIGGGITGAGVALDAATRGYTVALVERADWAIGTSSRSSKMVHGGLRYLQNFDLGLVREALLGASADGPARAAPRLAAAVSRADLRRGRAAADSASASTCTTSWRPPRVGMARRERRRASGGPTTGPPTATGRSRATRWSS